MASLEDIREGLAENIRAAFGPNVQCSGYLLSNPTPPCFEIELGPDGVDYHEAMQNGVTGWQLLVRGIVAANIDIGAQKKLDAWTAVTGTDSVKVAIERDRTLGGAAQTLLVESMTPYSALVLRDGSAQYLAAEWRIRVMT